MTKDLDWVKNQIVVLNVVGSNPTGYPPKVPENQMISKDFFFMYPPSVPILNSAGTKKQARPFI